MNGDNDNDDCGSIEIEAIALSKPGRREHNEDAHGLWHDGRYVIAVVADGAGGHGGGDVAATIVRGAVLAGFAQTPSIEEAVLRRLLDQANIDVVARQAEGGKLADMRSTVALAAIDLYTRTLVTAHSGDSRVYLFRDGAIVTRTADHSLVQQMVANGILDDEGARAHPQRNVLMSALGSAKQPPEISVSAPVQLLPSDVILLCSDGVWEPLGDAVLRQTLTASHDAGQWLAQLDALLHSMDRPEQDNYTAYALFVGAGGGDVSAFQSCAYSSRT
jgi:serine/threonine protein phosphatase PrpC